MEAQDEQRRFFLLLCTYLQGGNSKAALRLGLEKTEAMVFLSVCIDDTKKTVCLTWFPEIHQFCGSCLSPGRRRKLRKYKVFNISLVRVLNKWLKKNNKIMFFRESCESNISSRTNTLGGLWGREGATEYPQPPSLGLPPDPPFRAKIGLFLDLSSLHAPERGLFCFFFWLDHNNIMFKKQFHIRLCFSFPDS